MKLRDAGYREKVYVKAVLAVARGNQNSHETAIGMSDFQSVLDGVAYDPSTDTVAGRWIVQPAALGDTTGAVYTGIGARRCHVSVVVPGYGVRDCAEALKLYGMDDADCR